MLLRRMYRHTTITPRRRTRRRTRFLAHPEKFFS